MRIKLSKPLATHDGDINEITLKEPTGGFFLKNGLPWRQMSNPTTGMVEIDSDGEKMLKYMEHMSGQDAELLEGLSVRDMIAIQKGVNEMLAELGNA